MKLSFSLNASKKAGPSSSSSSKPTPTAPSLRKPTAFASLDDDEPLDSAASTSSALNANKRLAAQNVSTSSFGGALSRAQKAELARAKEVDPTVFEYDAVYDSMKDAQLRVKAAREEDPEARKAKYIHNLLDSAATRKLDYVRAEEKMIQREREAEGDEFADKEKFVTQAYKDQMAEVRRAEAEEKKREEEQRAKGATGMSHFYRELLQQSEREHAATIAATASLSTSASTSTKGPTLPEPTTNLRIQKPLKPAAKSDALIAALAKEEGKEVELNDDNQIVDHRELLSAGLNLAGVNTRRLGLPGSRTSSSAKDPNAAPVETHTAVGSAATKAEIRARQQALLRKQLEEEEERARKERERVEEEERDRAVKKRNNEDDVKSARERYLERKRRRIEDPTPATDD